MWGAALYLRRRRATGKTVQLGTSSLKFSAPPLYLCWHGMTRSHLDSFQIVVILCWRRKQQTDLYCTAISRNLLLLLLLSIHPLAAWWHPWRKFKVNTTWTLLLVRPEYRIRRLSAKSFLIKKDFGESSARSAPFGPYRRIGSTTAFDKNINDCLIVKEYIQGYLSSFTHSLTGQESLIFCVSKGRPSIYFLETQRSYWRETFKSKELHNLGRLEGF